MSSYLTEGEQTETKEETEERKTRTREREVVMIGLSRARLWLFPRGRVGCCAACEKFYLHGELMTLIYEECMKSSPQWPGCHSEPNFPCITFAVLR